MSPRICREELKVPTLTFESLINKYNISNISLLQIDTEGYDFEILKMVFSAKVFPEIINYEWTELSHKDRYECKKLLIKNGYRFIDVGADTLCLHNSKYTF